jgi:single-stranded DNA-binding protein
VSKSGSRYFSFALAENGKTFTEFYEIHMNERTQNVAQYITKGKVVSVVGNPALSAYMGKDGKPKAKMTIFATDVRLLGNDPNANGRMSNGEQNPIVDANYAGNTGDSGFIPVDVSQDELPF